MAKSKLKYGCKKFKISEKRLSDENNLKKKETYTKIIL